MEIMIQSPEEQHRHKTPAESWPEVRVFWPAGTCCNAVSGRITGIAKVQTAQRSSLRFIALFATEQQELFWQQNLRISAKVPVPSINIKQSNAEVNSIGLNLADSFLVAADNFFLVMFSLSQCAKLVFW